MIAVFLQFEERTWCDDDDDDDDDDDGVMKEMRYAYNYCAFAPQLSMVLFTLACGPVYFCV